MTLARRLVDAMTTGDAEVAIRSEQETYSFADIAELAHPLVGRLAEVSAESPVVVACAREPISLVTLAAVVLAGRPVVPVDVDDPPARIQHVVHRTRAQDVLLPPSRPELGGELPAARVTVACADRPSAPAGPVAARPTPDPDAVGAVLFTSGSTGRPKGVVYDQGLLERVTQRPWPVPMDPSDRLEATISPFNYLGGFWNLFLLAQGRTLTMYDLPRRGPAGLPDWIEAEGLTTVSLVPSVLRATLASMPCGRRFPTLRSIESFGEPLLWSDVAALRPRMSEGAIVGNNLASTEAPYMTMHLVDVHGRLGEGVVPVGRPVDGVQLALDPLDGDETIGEIVVSGELLARGYWDDPHLDAVRFVRRDGARAYRTGDLATRSADGVLRHRGRIDDAVKIRGHLVEPVEVQSALTSLPAIAEAAVLVSDTPSGRPRLVAHVVPEAGETCSPSSVRAALRARVAAHLVPSAVVVHESLPRTSRGKVDRAALADRARPAAALDGTGTDDLTGAVLRAFGTVLGPDGVSVDADFWELGGDSLAAQELVTELEGATGLRLPLDALVTASTVHAVRDRLARSTPVDELPVLNPDGHRLVVWCVAGGGGTALAFRALAEALGPDQPFAVLEAHGLRRPGLPDRSVEAAARRFAQTIRTYQPEGPYQVAGYSYGALVAYEVARRLRGDGAEVASVILLDPPSPSGAVPSVGARARRKTWRHLRREVDVLVAGVRPTVTVEYHRRFLTIAVRAARRYRPEPAQLPVLVVDSLDANPDSDPWARVVPDPERVSIPARHLELLQPPHVVGVAAAMQARLVDRAPVV